MKKAILSLAACAIAVSAAAAPRAIYVKKGDNVHKYNFGVASDITFGNGGKTLYISGYNELINLDEIDYISFNAPIDDMGLTPAQQKQKMVEIGEDINSYINLNKYSDILNMWHVFFDVVEAGGNRHYPPSTFEVPESYFPYRAAAEMMRTVKDVVEGNPTAIQTFVSKAVDIYKIEDFFGVYTADYSREAWRKAPSDHLELRFSNYMGGTYFIKMEVSNDFTTWNAGGRQGQMPKSINISFGLNDNEFATARILSTLVQDKSIDLNVEFKTADLKVINDMKVVDDKISNDVYITVDGKQFVTSHGKVDGENLVNYNTIYKDIEGMQSHWDDDLQDQVPGDASSMMARFIKGSVDVDVIGRLQVKGKAHKIGKLYNDLRENDSYETIMINNLWVYPYGKILDVKGGIVSVAYHDSEMLAKKAKLLNDYSDISIYYDNESTQQGYVSWDCAEFEYEPWEIWRDGHSGYANINGFLVYVRQFELGTDPDTGERIYTEDFFYSAYDGTGWNSQILDVVGPKPLNIDMMQDVDYACVPILTFPDQTSFYFHEFFDGKSFKQLVDDYNDIIDTYLKITGQDD